EALDLLHHLVGGARMLDPGKNVAQQNAWKVNRCRRIEPASPTGQIIYPIDKKLADFPPDPVIFG
ncbi:hypothetical protein, partial [Mesorhizobium sp. M7A.F.Ca.US.001.02.1.1]|uniref:hypothetical protein n=1 Tax=Mesorhizobium sp. M7A.F.Ca.US.001.02.1.1 TaxID=2496703 RepID=UPI0013E396A8